MKNNEKGYIAYQCSHCGETIVYKVENNESGIPQLVTNGHEIDSNIPETLEEKMTVFVRNTTENNP